MKKLLPPAESCEVVEVVEVNKPVTVYLAGLTTAGSRRTTRRALDVAARFFAPLANAHNFSWHLLRPEQMTTLRGHLAENLAPNSANRILAAVKQVLRQAKKLHLLTAEQLADLLDVRRVQGTREPKGRAMSLNEVQQLVSSAQKSGGVWRGTRNACMFAVLFGGGLRRAEVASLQLESCSFEDGRYTLLVRGKGNKERFVPLPSAMNELVHKWLRVRGSDPGALFPSWRTTDDGHHGREMNPENVRLSMVRLMKKLKMKHASPHDLRRTFISELLDRTKDPSTVQALAGHSNVQTTLSYDRRGARAKIKAVESLDVPFV